jgi:hypothetical protein
MLESARKSEYVVSGFSRTEVVVSGPGRTTLTRPAS